MTMSSTGLVAKGPKAIKTESGEKIDITSALSFKEASQFAEHACALFKEQTGAATFEGYTDRNPLADHIRSATAKAT
jgi:hypothetical protein